MTTTQRRYFLTYKFCKCHIHKLILMLQKGFCPYYCMCYWGKFDETSLPKKEGFYSNLSIEDIIDADYRQAKRFSKEFEIKTVGELVRSK